MQLLEAASVLVAMNQDGPTADSDNSSSPAASGSSDMRDEDVSITLASEVPVWWLCRCIDEAHVAALGRGLWACSHT